MPEASSAQMEVTVQGQSEAIEIPSVIDARVSIIHASEFDPQCALVPLIRFHVTLPMGKSDKLVKWALAPLDKGERFAKVGLSLTDREKTFTRTWSMKNGYVHFYREKEHADDAEINTARDGYIELVIQGVRSIEDDYDGQSIATMNQTDAPAQEAPPPAAPEAAPQPADEEKKTWIEVRLVDNMGIPIPYEAFKLKLPDGTIREGSLDGDGRARVEGIPEGKAEVCFPDRGIGWRPA